MSKNYRQKAIFDLVAKNQVPNQAALINELRKQGFKVTQATVSRDIAELDLIKGRNSYMIPKGFEQNGIGRPPDTVSTLRRTVTGVIEASNMLVVKTAAGSGKSTALALDSSEYKEILGTLGGDDTVFIATRSNDEALELKRKLLFLLK